MTLNSQRVSKLMISLLLPMVIFLAGCEGTSPSVDITRIETGQKAVMVFADQPEYELVNFQIQRSFQRFIHEFHLRGSGIMWAQVKSQMEKGIAVFERARKLRRFLIRSGVKEENIVELPAKADISATAVLTFSIRLNGENAG